MSPRPHLILPPGTQVVTRVDSLDIAGAVVRPRGAVGQITEAPLDGTHSYRVRFPDGGEQAFTRDQLGVHRHQLAENLQSATPESDLFECLIYRCIVGSRAYGLDHEESDTDRRGIYLPPAELHWSIYGVPEQIENDERQECYWELQKFLQLALKANPNILECLWTPLVERAEPLAQELIAMREMFLSKILYQTYNGYVLSQFRKIEQDLRARGAIKWKHAMHLVRLLLSGIGALRDHAVPVRVQEHRDQLLAIRRGETAWETVDAWRLRLHREFEDEFARTTLPDQPDYARANAFLIRARRSAT